MSETRLLHVMDKLSVDGSKIAGPARQLGYRLPNYPRGRYKVLLCSLRSEGSARDFLVEQGVEVLCLGRSKFDPRTLSDLQKLVTKWRPSILHLHGYASWTFGRIVGRRAGIPVVVQEHFIDKSIPLVLRVADRLLRKQQQMGLAVSGAVREFMVKGRYVRDTPIDVIWNAVPVEAIRSRAASADTRGLKKSLCIPGDAPVVGIVGRLAEMKGHRFFLDAAARIRRMRPDAHFVIVGHGPLRAALEQQAASLDLSDSVHFAGHQSDPVPFFAMFDVTVLTSVFGEGFHTVVLESLAAGTPVVLTDLDTYRGLYTNDHDVLPVPPGDPDAMAAAAMKLLTDPALTNRLLENAQQVLATCSLPSVVKSYLNFYEKMLHPVA